MCRLVYWAKVAEGDWVFGGPNCVFSLVAHVLALSQFEGLCDLYIGVQTRKVGLLSHFATYGYWGNIVVELVYSLCI